MKQAFLIITVFVYALAASAGIYRHDVPVKKYKELAAQKQFDCVGLVMDNYGQSAKGSCVLIGKKYVLCAAHVFIIHEYRVDTVFVDKNGKTVSKPAEGGATIWVNQPIKDRPDEISNYSFRFGDRRYYGKTLKIHHSYIDSLAGGNIFCGDLALIELTDSVTGIAPAQLNTSFDEKSAVITGVGFGASGRADKPEDAGPYLEKIAGQNTVDKLDGFIVDGKPSLLTFDFDHPSNINCNRMGSPKPLPLEWAPYGGDSGGGLFRQVNGKWQLVGIITGGPHSGVDMQQFMKTNGFYGGISENVRVSVFIKWIQETIRETSNDEMSVINQPK